MNTTPNENTHGTSGDPEVPPKRRRFTLRFPVSDDIFLALANVSEELPADTKTLDTVFLKSQPGTGRLSVNGEEVALQNASVQVKHQTTLYPMPNGQVGFQIKGVWMYLDIPGQTSQLRASVAERNEARGILEPRVCPTCGELFFPRRRDQVYDKDRCKTTAAVRRLRKRAKVAA